MGAALSRARVVLCVHNFAHQGVFSLDSFKRLGLPSEFAGLLRSPATKSAAEAAGGAATDAAGEVTPVGAELLALKSQQVSTIPSLKRLFCSYLLAACCF